MLMDMEDCEDREVGLLFIHSLTHSFIHSLIHSFTHSLTHSFTLSLENHSLENQSLTSTIVLRRERHHLTTALHCTKRYATSLHQSIHPSRTTNLLRQSRQSQHSIRRTQTTTRSCKRCYSDGYYVQSTYLYITSFTRKSLYNILHYCCI